MKEEVNYPTIECKEVHVGGTTFWFPIMITLFFILVGYGFPLMVSSGYEPLSVFSIGLIFLIIPVIRIIRNIIVRMKGKEIEGEVLEYVDKFSLTVKIIVDSNYGKRIINYELMDNKYFYEEGEKVKLLVYKDMFILERE